MADKRHREQVIADDDRMTPRPAGGPSVTLVGEQVPHRYGHAVRGRQRGQETG
jgi:hypothetical protein